MGFFGGGARLTVDLTVQAREAKRGRISSCGGDGMIGSFVLCRGCAQSVLFAVVCGASGVPVVEQGKESSDGQMVSVRSILTGRENRAGGRAWLGGRGFDRRPYGRSG